MPECSYCKSKFRLKTQLKKHLEECEPKETTTDEKIEEIYKCLKQYTRDINLSLELIKGDLERFVERFVKIVQKPMFETSFLGVWKPEISDIILNDINEIEDLN